MLLVRSDDNHHVRETSWQTEMSKGHRYKGVINVQEVRETPCVVQWRLNTNSKAVNSELE